MSEVVALVRKRVARVGEAVKREIGVILDQKLNDPNLGFVTVTRVDITDDLRYAKVFVSVLGGADEKEASMRRLRRARRFVRSELASSLSLRLAPEIRFVLDDSSEQYLRIAEVLKRIHEEDSPGE